MIKSLASALACSVCVVAMATPAQAQTREYDVPAGSLKQALDVYAQQSGRQIIYKLDEVRPVRSRGAKGKKTADAALTSILADTGFQASKDSSGAIAIVRLVGSQATGPSGEGAPVSVTGTITDERTGSNLKGASVTIEETGQSVATDDLGRYRFPSVRPGRYTLRISYLGYRDIVSTITIEAGRPFRQQFAMIGGDANNEIVVYGRRSARAQSLNQERTADNSTTVLSADLLGKFDGTTISESLRRAPGIAFQQDPVTGDGTNVIVRGLEPDLNQVTLNGLRLPDNSGDGRSPDLSNILTESISKITINKTLLPSQDGTGAGALIEVETKSPLDRPRRFASFGIEGAQSGGDFLEDYLVSGTVSGTFGADGNFGLSASVQYREREIETLGYNTSLAFGQYLPLFEDGTPVRNFTQLDPRTNTFPFEEGIDAVYPDVVTNSFNSTKTSNLSVTLSAQWQVSEHTDLKFDYSRAESEQDNFVRSALISDFGTYALLPVDELGGEIRSARVWEDRFAPFLPGLLLIGSQRYLSAKSKSTNNTYSLRGETELGKWEFDYSLGYAQGKTSNPAARDLFLRRSLFDPASLIDPSLLAPEALANTVNGRLVALYAPRSGNGYPLPLLSPAGFDFFNDTASFGLGESNISESSGENDRYTAKFDATYNFDSDILKYVSAGVFFESSEFRNTREFANTTITAAGLTAADAGLTFSEGALSQIGVDGGFNVLSRSSFDNFFASLDTISGLTVTENGPGLQNREGAFTKEENFAAYVQAKLQFGRLDIIGGVRLDQVNITSRNPQFPIIFDENGVRDLDFQERFTVLVDQEAKQTKLLPRILANFRINENLIIRGGYFLTIARPQIIQLSRNNNLTLNLRPTSGPNGDQPSLSIGQGNPDLEPSRTDNFDLSVEYYDNDIGAIKAAIFYKRTTDLLSGVTSSGSNLLEGVPLPDDPRFQNLPDNIFILGSKPVNPPFSAKIWGVEASIEKQFTFLPGALGGLGVFANYTYTDSSRTAIIAIQRGGATEQVEIPGTPFSQDPKHSGTAALTYNKYNIDATLAYTIQDRRLQAFQGFGVDTYAEQDSSLDLRAEYRFNLGGADMRAFFEGSDLLKGTSDPDVETSRGGANGTPKYFNGATFFGGRRFKVGLVATF